MLKRARAAHDNEDFCALSAGPEANGPWKRVEAADRFVVFRRQVKASSNEKRPNELEVLCAGRLDASLEEVASILRSSSEGEHNASMSALYAKDFIFGSYEREVPCFQNLANSQSETVTQNHEQLSQWCYLDYFQCKQERDGFTITKRALSPTESTPGRIAGLNARVDQLHGLSASYLVDVLPNPKGLRVVFHACSNTSSSTNPRRHSFGYGETSKHKAQLRRLLAMAHGVTKLPELIRRRRFGVQIPAKISSIQVANPRCPCCTHSLAPMDLAHLKLDTRRCFLCGYLVCADCWTADHMESFSGRVAAITVCTRCHVNVQACEYSEVFAGTAQEREKHSGPPRVVEDSDEASTVSLLVDFLSASLLNSRSSSVEHVAVMDVIRILLRQEKSSDDEDAEMEAVEKIREILSDEHECKLPSLEACRLINAQERTYLLDLPGDPNIDVPHSPIPSNEAERIASIKSAGLLELADIFAPETPHTDMKVVAPDVHDLELLCQLAVKTLGCAYAFVTIMCTKHEHIVVGTHPGFVGAAVPRAQTTCQHALMSPYPFMAAHHEADVRFHKHGATSAVPTRFYAGFPLTVEDGEMTVGMLCCIDSKPRAEITRTQYATMKRLASTSSHFLLQKSRQL
ncbi:uncharacterized protein PITG_15468 [Phytophthora infestans T30-4]|uniref:GAF domain-containing protein n=1 Tax=Phytophthora infestans (strain T30-4) TaxID=403677 RepID=D0NRB3_PHYIT|nr:uncharacterized protein PITG_15468 [Phytophthora infestans T30-4]EEY63235.1 conserved hypothetical protein [Phytophthora infestans T30-4]|eukprot:XP_002898412.1 conserved hypothetical protein [Phytophthora infestans T30-4]